MTMKTYPSDNTYSFSRINTFYNCPYSFYRKYFECEEGVGNGAAEFGSFVHLILEKYGKGELKAEELLDYYTEHYNEYVKNNLVLNFSGFRKNLEQNYYDDGYDYFESFQGFAGYKILGVEINFAEKISNEYIFNGQIDLLLEDEYGELVICDHKSKKKFASKKELKEYTRQLYLYSFYVKKHYGKFPKKLIFNLFRGEGFLVQDFNEDDYNEALSWFTDSVVKIEDEIDFDAKEGTFYCLNFCGFRNNMDDFCITKEG